MFQPLFMSCLKMTKTRLRDKQEMMIVKYTWAAWQEKVLKRDSFVVNSWKLSSYKQWSTDFRIMKACPNLMHQGKWQAGLENISSEKKTTLISLFALPPVPSCQWICSYYSHPQNDYGCAPWQSKASCKNFLVWRTFPIAFLDTLFISHLLTETFTRTALLILLWYAIQLDENFLNIVLKVIWGNTTLLL